MITTATVTTRNALSTAATTAITLARRQMQKKERIWTTPFSLMVNGNRMLGRVHTHHWNVYRATAGDDNSGGIVARESQVQRVHIHRHTEKERKLIKLFKITWSEAYRTFFFRYFAPLPLSRLTRHRQNEERIPYRWISICKCSALPSSGHHSVFSLRFSLSSHIRLRMMILRHGVFACILQCTAVSSARLEDIKASRHVFSRFLLRARRCNCTLPLICSSTYRTQSQRHWNFSRFFSLLPPHRCWLADTRPSTYRELDFFVCFISFSSREFRLKPL